MTDFAADAFTGADGTDLAVHTPDVGGAWTERYATTMAILSNRLHGPSSGDAYAIVTATPPSADYAIAADVIMSGSGAGNIAGVLGRFSFSPYNGYLAYWSDGAGEWILGKYNGDSYATINTWAGDTFSPGNTRRVSLEMAGAALAVKIDGVTQISDTDGSIVGVGNAGVLCEQGVSTALNLDNFTAGDATVSGVHVVTGRGDFEIAGLEWLSVSLDTIPSIASRGTAEPQNYFHIGIVSWQTDNGAMLAYPVTRQLELIHLPASMASLGYFFVPGITATITELVAP